MQYTTSFISLCQLSLLTQSLDKGELGIQVEMEMEDCVLFKCSDSPRILTSSSDVMWYGVYYRTVKPSRETPNMNHSLGDSPSE